LGFERDRRDKTPLETYSPSNWDYFRNVPIGWVNRGAFYGANLTATDGAL